MSKSIEVIRVTLAIPLLKQQEFIPDGNYVAFWVGNDLSFTDERTGVQYDFRTRENGGRRKFVGITIENGQLICNDEMNMQQLVEKELGVDD